MIKTPEIPSDNLYKFISIFGLVIFIFSIYSLIQTQSTFLKEIEDYSGKHKEALTSSLKIFHEKLHLEKQIHIQELKIKSITDLYPDQLNDSIIVVCLKVYPQIEIELRELEQLKFRKDNLTTEESSIEKNIEDLNEDNHTNPYSIPIFILGAIGLLSIIFGFRLWYYKTQIYIDQELAQKEESKQKRIK